MVKQYSRSKFFFEHIAKWRRAQREKRKYLRRKRARMDFVGPQLPKPPPLPRRWKDRPAEYKKRKIAKNRERRRNEEPEKRERRLAQMRLYSKTYRRTTPRKSSAGGVSRRVSVLPTGSVLICAAPSVGRDLLDRITRAVPRYEDRDEIVAEAICLVLDGVPEDEAVSRAMKTVAKGVQQFRYMKPIEECYFL